MRRASAVVVAALVLSGCAEPVPPAPAASTAPPSASASEAPSATPTPTPTPTVTPDAAPTAAPSPAAAPAPVPQAGAGAASLQVLVNKRRPLQPPDYVPEVVRVSGSHDSDGEYVRPELDAALAEIDAAMRAELGEGVHVFSSYRSYARQTQLYNGYVARYGQAAADRTSARPGHSEHQTGLAVDVVGTGGQCRLDVCFGDTPAGRWIADESWRFGFVVRYPEGLQGITGYYFEPWHLRYVGTEVSTAMHERGTATLEEHFGAGSAPDYG